MMERFHPANLVLGIVFVAAALLIALVWVPLDSATGLIEKVRRQVTIGDALAPTLAAGFLLFGGVIVAFFESAKSARTLTLSNIVFVLSLVTLIGVSFGWMRWVGPAIAALVTDDGYRPRRDMIPWKFIGFGLGGVCLIAGLIALVERRLSWRGLVVGLVATAVLIAVYDLPFDDLLLPPNGDV
jgi:cytochrome bd-type quinol oxidase subunit 2